jgi:hypothetical protein
MKSMALVLLTALLAFGVTAAVDAQSGNNPAGTRAPATQAPAPGAQGADDSSALPRSAVTERTTIFGLSPPAALVIAAALLVVVILAIVAMTRSGDQYIDTNRRV